MNINGFEYTYPTTGFHLTIPDLTVPKGRIIGIMGTNGAGKTTLLKVLSGIIPVKGAQLAPIRQLSFLQAHLGLFQGTVRRNLSYPLAFRKVPALEITRRVEEIAEVFGIAALLDVRVSQLSSGQRQRTGLARAMIYRPDYLLLDEPTANVDAAHILEIEALLRRRVSEDGTTLFLVTHSMSQARRLCDEWWYMDQGVLVESGPVHELLTAPRTPSLQRWIQLETQ